MDVRSRGDESVHNSHRSSSVEGFSPNLACNLSHIGMDAENAVAKIKRQVPLQPVFDVLATPASRHAFGSETNFAKGDNAEIGGVEVEAAQESNYARICVRLAIF